MRACEPSDDGVVERGGVKIHYEVYGEGRPTILLLPTWAIGLCRTERFIEACIRVRCPVLVIHGDADRIRPHAQGAALAEATSGTLVTLEGAGHFPMTRDPVPVNLLIKQFVGRVGR